MKKLTVLIFSLLTLPLTAQELNTQALKACSFVENDFQRLQCYDQVVAGKELTATKQTAKGKGKPAVVGQEKAAEVNANAANKHDNFGLEHKKIEKQGDEISSVVTAIQKKVRGELIITLENGHVWQQIGSDQFTVKEGEVVTISRGLFNSFILKVEGRNRGIKVKRK